MKPPQTKPGWPVRPATSTQSPWGNPSNISAPPSAPGNVSQQAAMSPRSNKQSSVRMPVVSQAALTAQPADVSRRLFPEPKPPAAYPVKPPSAVQQLHVQTPTQHQIPNQLVSQSHMSSSSHPSGVSNALSGVSYRSPNLSPYTAPHSAAVGPAPVNMTRTTVYSPFDKPLHPQNLGYSSSAVDRSQVDPKKAPGFRPSNSPQLSQYPSSSPQMMAATDEMIFSKAPGGGGGACRGPLSSAEQLMSPLTTVSLSSNVHALFSESSGMPPQLHHNAMMNAGHLMGEHYTTPDQPMTLPRISSSLNPNASEFNAGLNNMPPFGMNMHNPQNHHGYMEPDDSVGMYPSDLRNNMMPDPVSFITCFPVSVVGDWCSMSTRK